MIPIRDMTDDHLLNALRFARRRRDEGLSPPAEPMASYYDPLEYHAIDSVFFEEWKARCEEVDALIRALRTEVKRRVLKEKRNVNAKVTHA